MRKGQHLGKWRCLGAVVLFTDTPSAKLLPDILPVIESYCRKTNTTILFPDCLQTFIFRIELVYLFYLCEGLCEGIE